MMYDRKLEKLTDYKESESFFLSAVSMTLSAIYIAISLIFQLSLPIVVIYVTVLGAVLFLYEIFRAAKCCQSSKGRYLLTKTIWILSIINMVLVPFLMILGTQIT